MFSAVLVSVLSLLLLTAPHSLSSSDVCIVGSGIAGSSLAYFLREYSDPSLFRNIRIFERNDVVGGRMATVSIAGETFEAGASILHPKNYYVLNFTKMLNLEVNPPSSSSSFAIWDGKNKFVFRTLAPQFQVPFYQKIISIVNSIIIFARYGFSLVKMDNFVETTVSNFVKYYEPFESRPIFETADEMLKWAALYNLTTRSLREELIDAGLSPLLIEELVTVITRINYGQSVSISGLAGAVSLAGSDSGVWSVKGGNWQIAAGLINSSDASLHLNEEIEFISQVGEHYELNSTKGNSYACDITVVATPLDELNIRFDPPISIHERKLQHTHATFVRGLVNPAYFGLKDVSEIPQLVGTMEDPNLPLTSISILKKHGDKEMTYKIFSRQPLADDLLNLLFSKREETIRRNWGAYPQYNAPEVFSPFILDGKHLYYVNAFENAASTVEVSAVVAENIARLILSRLSDNKASFASSNLKSSVSERYYKHREL